MITQESQMYLAVTQIAYEIPVFQSKLPVACKNCFYKVKNFWPLYMEASFLSYESGY